MGLVSIIIPAYNAEKFLEETIQSVFNQTYKNWEVIIINDGSKDKTDKVCGALSKKDKRVKYYNQSNSGVSKARNNGIARAKGDFIAFLDADDVWLPENLSIKTKYFYDNPDVDWVYSDMYHADGDLNIIEEAPKGRGDDILNNILLWEGEVVPGPCSNLIVKRKCVEGGCKYDSRFSTAADQDFCIQLSSKYVGGYIAKPLWKYRYIAESMSRNISVMEKDHIGVFKKAEKRGLFKNNWFKRKCFANLYLILAGSWWVNGNNKKKGLKYIILSFFCNPLIFFSWFKKKLLRLI